MAQTTYPAAGGGSYVLRQTITSPGSVTIPASQTFVFAQIGTSQTNVIAQGWVPADSSYTSITTTAGNTMFFYSFLCAQGTSLNLYISY